MFGNRVKLFRKLVGGAVAPREDAGGRGRVAAAWCGLVIGREYGADSVCPAKPASCGLADRVEGRGEVAREERPSRAARLESRLRALIGSTNWAASAVGVQPV